MGFDDGDDRPGPRSGHRRRWRRCADQGAPPGTVPAGSWFGEQVLPPRWLVLHVALAGGLAVSLVVTVALLQRQERTYAAIADAEGVSLAAGRGMVEPALQGGVVTGQRPALDRLDRVVHQEVLTSSLLRVKLWRPDGTIVYSDEPRLIGDHFSLSEAQRRQLADGRVDAAVTDMISAEHRYEPDPRMLEVYTPLHAEDGTPLLLETYFRYRGVTDTSSSFGGTALAIAAACGLALLLLEVGFAYGVLRRLRGADRIHHRLVHDALDTERRRIAGGLHDSVVQDLTGVALQLAAISHDAALAPAAASLRDSIRVLRSLLVDVYPRTLHCAGLDVALGDLLVAFADRGIHTHLVMGVDAGSIAPASTEALYRAAQEALRNVAVHACARSVRVVVTAEDQDIVLRVDDDGRGFWAGAWHHLTPHGHLGLRATADLLAGVGGRLNVRSFPGEGTRVTARVRRHPTPEPSPAMPLAQDAT
jgi:two-component system NarL family sensor kinase